MATRISRTSTKTNVLGSPRPLTPTNRAASGDSKKSRPSSKANSVANSKYRANIVDTNTIDRVPVTWLHISQEQLTELEATEFEDLPKKFASMFKSAAYKEDLKAHIPISFHVNNYLFAKECKFNPAQIATFFSIMALVYNRTMDATYPMTLAITEFQKVLVNHSSNLGDDFNVFDPEDARLVSEFAFSTIFQHYRLFTAYHSIQPELVQLQETKKIGTPFTPQPLAESQTLEAYEIELGISPEFSMNKETDLYGNDQNDTEDNEEKPKEEDENPLDLLKPEEIKQITSDTVTQLFASVNADFEKQLEDQKAKFMAQVAKLTSQ